MRNALLLLAMVLEIAPMAACEPALFACERDDQCNVGRDTGVCEVVGFCSFTDGHCASGRVWGEHAPEGIANECVALHSETDPCGDDGACASEDSGDALPGTPRPGDDDVPDSAPEREPGGGPPPTHADVPLAPAHDSHCSDGVRNHGESDTDCGGSCTACGGCAACKETSDCAVGSCDEGSCRTIEVLELDWRLDCGALQDLPVGLWLPPGVYLATALPSAGSRWNNDGAAGGLAWSWRLECNDVSFGDLGTLPGQGFASPEAAFAGLTMSTALVELAPDASDPDSAALACGVVDSFCDDNRGGVALQLESWCP